MKLTADTITDDMIRELRTSCTINAWRDAAVVALGKRDGGPVGRVYMTKAAARARCAEILNQRRGVK